MHYETIEHLKESDFKRLTGVQRETFEQMLEVVEKSLRAFGRPTKISTVLYPGHSHTIHR